MVNAENSYYLNRGILRYEILTGHSLYSKWTSDPLIPWQEDFQNLSYQHYPSKEIKLNSIVGSIHPDYNGLKSWLEFLGALKKVNSHELLIYYSEFFKSNREAPDAKIIEYKGQYWIAEGNNRICIARFMNIESIIVPVSEYYSTEDKNE
jgi:hypothetical protein